MSEPAWVALGAGPVDYKGDYAAGTQYAPGDVVRHNGVDYLAVNPSLGSTPPSALPASIPLVTALPGSPVDGQEVILVDVIGAATYSWRLRYVAARASNRWIFIGGSRLSAEIATQEARAVAAAYDNLATVGPSITPPVTGMYEVEHGCAVVNAAGFGYGRMSYDIGATGAVDADSVQVFHAQAGSGGTSISRVKSKTLTGGQALLAKYKAEGAGQSFANRWLAITPKAVGG